MYVYIRVVNYTNQTALNLWYSIYNQCSKLWANESDGEEHWPELSWFRYNEMVVEMKYLVIITIHMSMISIPTA